MIKALFDIVIYMFKLMLKVLVMSLKGVFRLLKELVVSRKRKPVASASQAMLPVLQESSVFRRKAR